MGFCIQEPGGRIKKVIQFCVLLCNTKRDNILLVNAMLVLGSGLYVILCILLLRICCKKIKTLYCELCPWEIIFAGHLLTYLFVEPIVLSLLYCREGRRRLSKKCCEASAHDALAKAGAENCNSLKSKTVTANRLFLRRAQSPDFGC